MQPDELSIAGLIRAAWDTLQGRLGLAWKALGLYFGTSVLLIAFFVLIAPADRPPGILPLPNPPGFIDELVHAVILLPMLAGLWMFSVVLSRRLSPNPFSIFTWYDQLLKLLLVNILSHLMILLGTALLVLPGIYLLVSYQFAIPLAVDKGLGPWEAMECSRKLIGQCWFLVFALTLLAALALFASLLLLGIPLIWVLPMLMLVWGKLYDALAKAEDDTVAHTLASCRARGLPRHRN